MNNLIFDKVEFGRNFYNYIKNRYGNFRGTYDDLYTIYKLDYCSILVETNSEEKNKFIIEFYRKITNIKYKISPDSYKTYANYAYCILWNTVRKEFDLCEYSDAETDSE